jgi:DNA-binding response OmpR family regulator
MAHTAETEASYRDHMTDKTTLSPLSDKDRAVLRVLIERVGKVTDRASLNKMAGLTGTPRRCETILVTLRRALGEDAIVTIRRRGWMLSEAALPRARRLIDT